MKETKLPEGCKDNSVSASDGSWSLPDKPTSLPKEDCQAAIKKQLSYNRGSFSGPLATDEVPVDLAEMEAKSETGSNEEGEGKENGAAQEFQA